MSMRVTRLLPNPYNYTCNAYLVRGDYNGIDDVNTLIDIGTDAFVLQEIEQIYTGVGKKPIEQVIFTHSHFDHTGGMKYINEKYSPKVLGGFDENYITKKLHDGDFIRIGDALFEAIHIPGHSQDSYCFFNSDEGILFSGDCHFDLDTCYGNNSETFYRAIKRLSSCKITIIYPGHGAPLKGDSCRVISNLYECMRKLNY